MNVVQINYAVDPDLDDPEVLLARYATLTGWSDALANAGADVRVVQRFRSRAVVRGRGVEYQFTPSPNLDLWRMRSSVQIAHVNGLVFPLQTWLLRQLLSAKCPIVLQDHGGDPHRAERRGFARARHRLRRTLLAAADAFLFTAAEQGDPWRSAGLIAPGQRVFDVIEASTTFTPSPREVARPRTNVHGAPAVLWVGRLNANKDPLTVLGGFERSLSNLPDATLTMIFSKDDLLADVRSRIESSALLRSRVRLIGSVPHDDLPEYYSAADVFVVGSHHEGSGYSLLEACACGTTPVVTDIPSFRAITGRGAIGALWQPGDAACFAHVLESVSRRDLNAQRADVVRHFERTLSWQVIGRRAVEIYGDVIAARGSGRAMGL